MARQIPQARSRSCGQCYRVDREKSAPSLFSCSFSFAFVVEFPTESGRDEGITTKQQEDKQLDDGIDNTFVSGMIEIRVVVDFINW
jgi:hypothetical protein